MATLPSAGLRESAPLNRANAPPITMSAAFTADAHHGAAYPDVILSSSDNVYFYVVHAVLQRASTNSFGGLLPIKSVSPLVLPLARVSDSADVLNIILHAIYDMSPARFTPSPTTLIAALERLPAYGLAITQYATPPRPLYHAMLMQAPLAPLAVYTAAARYGLEDLAVAMSPHLLSLSLSSVTDEQAEAMGAVYLGRLFLLHKKRMDALRDVLAAEPYPHPETPDCSFVDQKAVARAWQLASAYLVSKGRPDLHPLAIQSTVNSLAAKVTCKHCKEVLRRRLQKAVVEWMIILV
ncbi:uncharacterized protein SCHCODRAFT_02503242 [Schizophyllum commune H4-8]|uniref:BTB domain-containing protein n=1 Tax=Schizophyllum commune (strain H4-8 / FGSC 9210) TaxID=578458 RepID=D8Q4Q4_SCHCM|nr:uncharacterized protein SCHCODRAFT_02503242 [Schizophyllum commune H4-8]KAI5892514.1 hypothetical protein SCHCODRAFT_02503242 [Schizophyllum commune H4-8]